MAQFKSEMADELIKYLQGKGFANVEDTEKKYFDKYYCYDVYGVKGMRKCGFEIKHRTFPSTKYGDAIIEYHKYEKILKKMKNGEINVAFIVTIFSDKTYVTKIDDEYVLQNAYGEKTTFFNDKKIMEKTYVSYNLATHKKTKEITL